MANLYPVSLLRCSYEQIIATLLPLKCDIWQTSRASVDHKGNTVNFGYKRFRYKGFSLITDYAKGP